MRLLWLLLIARADRLATGCTSGVGLRVGLTCGGKERGRGRLLAGLTLSRATWRRRRRSTAKAAGCARKASLFSYLCTVGCQIAATSLASSGSRRTNTHRNIKRNVTWRCTSASAARSHCSRARTDG